MMDTCVITTYCNGFLVLVQALLSFLISVALGFIIGYLIKSNKNKNGNKI